VKLVVLLKNKIGKGAAGVNADASFVLGVLCFVLCSHNAISPNPSPLKTKHKHKVQSATKGQIRM
jgi:hypothetical protein